MPNRRSRTCRPRPAMEARAAEEVVGLLGALEATGPDGEADSEAAAVAEVASSTRRRATGRRATEATTRTRMAGLAVRKRSPAPRRRPNSKSMEENTFTTRIYSIKINVSILHNKNNT